MAFQEVTPNTGHGGAGHVVQLVRRTEDLNNNQKEEEEEDGLSIRNESGESLEDIVSIVTVGEVCEE